MRVGIRVTCAVCHRMKKPIGRSASLETANSYCDDECSGYRQPPFVGSLWPGETEEEFGYPVGSEGTIIAPPVAAKSEGKDDATR